MFAVKVAFVARENDECIVQLLLVFECVENVGNTTFHRSEHPQPIANGFVVSNCFRTKRR